MRTTFEIHLILRHFLPTYSFSFLILHRSLFLQEKTIDRCELHFFPPHNGMSSFPSIPPHVHTVHSVPFYPQLQNTQYCIVPPCSATFWTHPEIIPVGQFFRRWIQSINQSTNPPINQSIDSINQSINQSTNQSIHQSIHPSINPPINPSIDSINGLHLEPEPRMILKKCILLLDTIEKKVVR